MSLSAVYRVFNREDELLYIGVTKNIRQRIKSHRQLQQSEPNTYESWVSHIDHIHMRFFTDRRIAEIEEAHAIKSENPLHNYQNNVCMIHDSDKQKEEMLFKKYRRHRIYFNQTGNHLPWRME